MMVSVGRRVRGRTDAPDDEGYHEPSFFAEELVSMYEGGEGKAGNEDGGCGEGGLVCICQGEREMSVDC